MEIENSEQMSRQFFYKYFQPFSQKASKPKDKVKKAATLAT